MISAGLAADATVLGTDPEVVVVVTTAVKNRAEIPAAQLAELRRGELGRAEGSGPGVTTG